MNKIEAVRTKSIFFPSLSWTVEVKLPAVVGWMQNAPHRAMDLDTCSTMLWFGEGIGPLWSEARLEKNTTLWAGFRLSQPNLTSCPFSLSRLQMHLTGYLHGSYWHAFPLMLYCSPSGSVRQSKSLSLQLLYLITLLEKKLRHML